MATSIKNTPTSHFDNDGNSLQSSRSLRTSTTEESIDGFDAHALFMARLSIALQDQDAVTFKKPRMGMVRFPVTELPTPVLVNILHCMPDTATLYESIKAARVFNDLFYQYKSNILFSVVQREIPKHTQAFECLSTIRSLSPRATSWLRRTGFKDLPDAWLNSAERTRLHIAEAKYLLDRATWDTFSWRELTLYLSSLKFPHGSEESAAPLVDIRKIFHQPLPVHYYMASTSTAHYDYRETFRMRIGYWIDEDLNSDDWWRKDYWKRISMGGCMFGGYKAWERRRGYADG